VVGPDVLGGIGAALLGQLAVLAAGLCYAAGSILGRRFKALPPAVAAAGQTGAAALLLLPIAMLADQPWRLPWPSASALGALLGLGLLSTALGYVLYFRILAVAGATNITLVALLAPVSALLLGHLVLGEALTAGGVAGMALIMLGLATVDGRPLRRLRPLRAGARPAR
jgi:drug/metabolite transporter (DMT)-like permease